MTIKELKEELNKYPDDWNVALAMPHDAKDCIVVNNLNMVSEGYETDEVILEFNQEVAKFNEVAEHNSKELEKLPMIEGFNITNYPHPICKCGSTATAYCYGDKLEECGHKCVKCGVSVSPWEMELG